MRQCQQPFFIRFALLREIGSKQLGLDGVYLVAIALFARLRKLAWLAAGRGRCRLCVFRLDMLFKFSVVGLRYGFCRLFNFHRARQLQVGDVALVIGTFVDVRLCPRCCGNRAGSNNGE